MGNFKCEIHIQKKEDEANFDNKVSSQVSESSRPFEIISMISSNNQKLKGKNTDINKLNNIKINLEKKFPKLGNYLSVNDFRNMINEKILDYIETHRLNYQTYSNSNSTTYQSNPIEFPNGNIYYGNWNIDSEMEGYGIYFIKDKDVVTEGRWLEGNIIYGRIFFPNDDIYEGDMQNSLPHGGGTIFFSNGEIYKGDFIDGEMTGKGTFIYVDKTYYSGDIKEGIFYGKGSMKWNNGTEYHGFFINSALSGKGKMFNNNMGEKYIGHFDRNEFNGKGTYTYKNGDIYEGSFEYGIKKGEGLFKRNDKLEFEGIWNDDLPNGNGIVTYKDNKLKGFWRNGIIVGDQEIIQGNIEHFKDLDLDIKPNKSSLCPSSLPHLSLGENNVSQFIPRQESSYM